MSFPFKYSSSETGCVLYIKHMVCARGAQTVRLELEKLGLVVHAVRLGAATVAHAPDELDWQRIRKALAKVGFALLKDPAYARVTKVKQLIADLLHRPNAIAHRDFIPTLTQTAGLSARQLHRLFAQQPAPTSLLSYIKQQRLLCAQELLITSPAGIGQIARQLGYSSLAHFSGQFRRFAHCAPSTYRQQRPAPADKAAPAALNNASEQAHGAKPGP
ncbi:helix-turn-helix transcriptional regulator [Hymenobacter terrestris]|uniref:Helix-turn-helix transcriptional regulator n=1 Tax=Hymenobacter terrestris TaxID=2748310 RepID=A0ABX2Q7N5_9BACT|nr:helix-turn-helix transcriptional regulator [Hymenobacter terrestris]NVO86280.1 helix-turn-helix transcriptional regulator [Hymenobacter terrestris]